MNPHDPSPLWLHGARVIDPATGRDEPNGDVFIRDGVFAEKLTAEEQ